MSPPAVLCPLLRKRNINAVPKSRRQTRHDDPLPRYGRGHHHSTTCLSTWSPTGSMSIPRGSSVATLLPDGRVLDTGGWGYSVDYPGYSTPVAGAELYDPRLGTWMPTAAMSTPRSQHAVALLRDGRVLVSGGMRASSILASAEIYNPALGTRRSR
jgi:hypothetical protein